MLPALGQCEDLQCQTNAHENVRLFRCSIHCDRNLCLFHLNAHNVYYEQEKKQNSIVINELQNCLTVYQTLFEKQITAYRELVRQASTILLQNASSLVPSEQIQTVLDRIQEAIAIYQEEKIIIKCESSLDEIEKNPMGQKVVVRIPRIECETGNDQIENNENISKSVIDIPETRHTPKKIETKKKNGGLKRLQK